jgi:GTP-binding protein Era
VPKPSLLPILERLTGEGLWAEVVPVSALSNDGVDLVRGLVRARLPEGPVWFEEEPADSAAPDHGFIQEVIQESLFARLKQEIPYSCAVQVETVEVEGGLIRIEAAILAERESHKPILVGAGGAMVKAVGTEARQALEKAFGKKVYLSLRVRVVEDWRNRESILADLGYAAGDRDRDRGGGVV